MSRAAALILVACLSGCGEDQPLPAEVDAVIEVRCRRCHSDPPREFAPMPMVTWDDLQAPAPGNGDEPVYRALARRIVDPDFPMPPFRTAEADAFTDAERAVLLDWVDAGAPPAADDPP